MDNFYDACSMYAPTSRSNISSSNCSANSFNVEKIVKCDRYIFDTHYFDETLATKFGLVCENEYKRQLLDVIMMLGILIGSVVGGTLGDKFGRKLIMMIAAVTMCPVILGSGFIPNFGGIGSPGVQTSETPTPLKLRVLGVSGVWTPGLPILSKFGILGVSGVPNHEL